MPKTKVDKRTQLIQSAVKLVYRHGFRKTTLADIAEEAKVPLGNLYYYFKTKDEIGEAIVEQRRLQFQALRKKYEQAISPKERLRAFVQKALDSRETLARNGCPIGTLCYELRKDGGQLAGKAMLLLAEPLAWLEAQFLSLGKGDDSQGLALHLLSAIQGAAVLANSFQNPDLIVLETRRLEEWLQAL